LQSGLDQIDVVKMIPVIDRSSLQQNSWLNLNEYGTWIILVFIIGVIIFLVRLAMQFYSYLQLQRSSELLTDMPVKLYHVDKNIVPFSFGNAIFINQEQHNESELREIIRHEFVHVKQRHTADMIWAEVLCIVNWYNPFAWMIKKVIRQNLEFIADQQVLQNGLDKKQYQYLLLKVAGSPAFRIANQFNFSFLKKRIAMMNKMKSARLHLVKFAFVLPLIAVLLLSFREQIGGLIEMRLTSVEDNKPLNAQSIQTGGKMIVDTVPVDNTAKDSVLILPAGKRGAQPLIIVDDVVRDENFVSEIKPEIIVRIEVLKAEHAQIYGSDGKHGVIKITTNNQLNVTARSKVKVSVEQKLQFSATADKQVVMRNMSDLTTLVADSIILLNEKTEFHSKDSVMMIDASQRNKDKATRTLSDRHIYTTSRQPLYIIDGIKQVSPLTISKIDQDLIESVSVLKDKTAVELYGPEAVQGVILITTKKNHPAAGAARADTLGSKPGHRP
jgi:TonB-dependent SusC/RagA subfamily outer membrane receptor